MQPANAGSHQSSARIQGLDAAEDPGDAGGIDAMYPYIASMHTYTILMHRSIQVTQAYIRRP